MANEAYRAVFLRIHPTGKMVLSLTTEPDGHESEYAQLVAAQLGVPPLDVKVVPADGNRFGEGHGFNTAPSPGAPAAITSATGKILDKARLLAGAALSAEPESLRWDDGAFITVTEPAHAATIADLAMYSLSSGELPPGVEGGLDAQTVYRD
jgi:carbon-monoxide dehydrogenase large subunit